MPAMYILPLLYSPDGTDNATFVRIQVGCKEIAEWLSKIAMIHSDPAFISYVDTIKISEKPINRPLHEKELAEMACNYLYAIGDSL
jgi:hypothetical protein